MALTLKQNNAVYYLKDKSTTEIVFGGGAGGGKSFLGVGWIIESSCIYPGSRWVIGRAKLKTLKDTTLKTFFEVIAMAKMHNQINYNQQNNTITFWNGSEVLLKDLFLYPSDPDFDSLGSLEITGAFVDECNQITKKAWQILKSRIRYKLDEFGLIPKILGTCNPSKNWVKTDFYNYPRSDFRAFVQSLATDNEYISKHYIQNLGTLDENSKQRLLYGNWDYDSDPDRLIDFEDIENLFSNEFVHPNGKLFISADIALHGSDNFVFGIWNGFVLEKVIMIPKCEAPEVERQLKLISIDFSVPRSNIVYDADGLGSFLRGYLFGAAPFNNNGSPLNGENFNNIKSQCGYKLAELIGVINIKDSKYQTEITTELGYLKRWNADKDGKKQIMPKDEIKKQYGKSPDFLDMLIMRMYFELKPQRKGLSV